MKPLIGITGDFECNYCCVNQEYIEAIEKAGGIPVILPVFLNAFQFLKKIDGLLLTGGGRGIQNIRKGKNVLGLFGQNKERYLFERFLIEKAVSQKIPVLGICRGHQMIAEVLGGEMRLDVEGHYRKEHGIVVDKRSRLYGLLGEKIKVNSIHRQCVETVPEGFIVSAVSDDGITEGIECTGQYIVGIQFHPEKMKDDRFLGIFKDFVTESRG